MKKSVAVSALLILSSIFTSSVQATETAKPEQYSQLKKQLGKILNGEIKSVSPTPVNGLYEVVTPRGIVYASKDGSYLIQGDLYDLSKGVVNLTEAAMSGIRLKLLKAQVPSMISYPAKNEKYIVTVFTDVDCGYCRKLHQQISGYNKLGITIRYLAFPRGGKASNAYSQMEAIWCSDDPAKAMTDAKNGQNIKSKQCKNPIDEHYALGNRFGVRGTPALVLENGNLLPGYLPPAKLLNELQNR